MTQRVGLIGLGRMGVPIAKTLMTAGFEVIATSRSLESREVAKEAGVSIVDTPAAVASCVKFILVSVFDTSAVEHVVQGEDGVLSTLTEGTVVIDLGTTGLDATLVLAEQIAQREAMFVDAPVSGGTRGASEGRLTIMAGGTQAAIEKAGEVLKSLGRLNHMGPVGAGQSTKAVNQLVLGQTLVAVAEGMTLARCLGLDPAAVREALLGGFAESRVLLEHGKRMVESNYTPGGSIAVFHKDLRLVRDLSEGIGLHLSGLLLAENKYNQAILLGMANLDQSAVLELYKK